MIKKLVFFLYIGENVPAKEFAKTHPTMRLHYTLLRRYSNVFNESVFVLSLKKELIGNKELIKDYMSTIIDLGFYNVRFKVEENTQFRECKAFKEEVVENKDNEDKLVFFGHNKGTTNNFNESLVRLICSMYYFGLNFMDDAEAFLIGDERVYYGFPLLNAQWSVPEGNCVMPLFKYFYYGTFFWTNVNVLNEVVTHKGREFPKMTTRYYAENFPANTVEFDLAGVYGNTYAVSGKDLHYDFDGSFNEYCDYASNGAKIKENFNEFVNNVKLESLIW